MVDVSICPYDGSACSVFHYCPFHGLVCDGSRGDIISDVKFGACFVEDESRKLVVACSRFDADFDVFLKSIFYGDFAEVILK